MSNKTYITISVDSEVKAKAKTLFEEMGTDMSNACNMFLTRCIREQGFPYTPTIQDKTGDALNYLRDWLGYDLFSCSGLQKYIQCARLPLQEMCPADLLRIIDAITCVVGQCGYTGSDASFMELIQDSVPAYFKNVDHTYVGPANNAVRADIAIPDGKLNRRCIYTLSPFMTWVMEQSECEAGSEEYALAAIDVMYAAASMLETIISGIAENERAGYGYWTNTFLSHIGVVIKTLKAEPEGADDAVYNSIVSCSSLRYMLADAEEKLASHHFADAYGDNTVLLAAKLILSEGYEAFAPEERVVSEAKKEMTPKEERMAKIEDCVFEIAESQDFDTIYDIISREMRHRLKE